MKSTLRSSTERCWLNKEPGLGDISWCSGVNGKFHLFSVFVRDKYDRCISSLLNLFPVDYWFHGPDNLLRLDLDKRTAGEHSLSSSGFKTQIDAIATVLYDKTIDIRF